MPKDPDVEILRRFVQGDRDAFESLFRQFEVEVYHWILRIVRDPGASEDVLVEVFWRAYRGRARFDPSRSFGAWVRTLATNAARDHLRTIHRRARSITTKEDMRAPTNMDPVLNESIALAFRKLPPKLQIVATLALIEERPYGEIADTLDLPVGTVKSRAFRVVRALRKELARRGIRP